MKRIIFKNKFQNRIAVFSIRVLRDERIVIVAEQRPDSSEEEVIYLNFVLNSFLYFRLISVSINFYI